MRFLSTVVLASFVIASISQIGCSREVENTLYIGGIPDQEVARLEDRFNGIADYLTQQTGITVRYIPSIDYAALVTAFKQGDIDLGWFGGLTGVQARLATPDALAIAQRARDAAFRSVFVANPALALNNLENVQAKRLTFGSESSTSGHLMPRFYLTEAGIDLDHDLKGPINFSGSHDKTWKLVEAGAFDVGALNEAVWDTRVSAGDVDLTKVDVFFRTPPYYDYHWVVMGTVDEEYGTGTLEKIKSALLRIRSDGNPEERAIATAFRADSFIETSNENYTSIEQTARELRLVE